ncbi:MAG: hypothetical protein RI556_12570, partial [Hydrogenovibrio sp.]|uniref:hypothetical protein n=1 Tax=Hydrogenovibrio sp. TaxID=2065821 RepID=UPI00287067C1
VWQAPFVEPAAVYRAPARTISQYQGKTVVYQLENDRLQPLPVEIKSYEADQVVFALSTDTHGVADLTLVTAGTSTTKSLLQTRADASTNQGATE